MTNPRIISFPELRSLKGIRFSRQHLRRLIVAGKFPKPLKIGEATNGWIEAEVDAWIAGKAAERDTQAA